MTRVSCGLSGTSFERSGKKRRSRNFGPSRKRSSVVFRMRSSMALGVTAPRLRHENLVQVRAKPEPVTVPVPVEVVAGRGEPFEHGLDIGQVDVGPADGGANLGERRLGLVLALAAVGLHEDGRGDLLVEPGLADGFGGLLVELLGVRCPSCRRCRSSRGPRAGPCRVARRRRRGTSGRRRGRTRA